MNEKQYIYLIRYHDEYGIYLIGKGFTKCKLMKYAIIFYDKQSAKDYLKTYTTFLERLFCFRILKVDVDVYDEEVNG